MASFLDYFRGKKALVTGHTGFKGAWLSLWLHRLGASVAGFALAPAAKPNFFESCKLETRIKSHIGDIRDLDRLKQVLAKEEPEIIFHLAAQPLVRLSYLKPSETFSVNFTGTLNLLEAIREIPTVRVCQIVTSDKCYENRESGRPFSEQDPLGGRDPYSASKASAELAVAAYRHSFFPPEKIHEHGVSVSSVRAGNVIGGGDWGEDRLIPDCIRALSQKKSIPIRNPSAIRPWQYVLDALSGYLQLAEQQAMGSALHASAWNFGPEEAHLTVAELTEQVIKLWGSGSWSSSNPEKPFSEFYESASLRLDCSKANRLLNWHPVLNTEEGIEETVEWYRRFYQEDAFDPLTFSLSQLARYEKKLKERGHSWTLYQKEMR